MYGREGLSFLRNSIFTSSSLRCEGLPDCFSDGKCLLVAQKFCHNFETNWVETVKRLATSEYLPGKNPDAGSRHQLWWSLKCFLLNFHLWIFREQKFAPYYSQRTPLLKNAQECDHVRWPFWFDKQSHVTKIVDVWCQSQLSRVSLNSRSTCFGSINIFRRWNGGLSVKIALY